MFTEGTVSFREAKPLLEKCGLYPVDCAELRIGIWDAQDELAATGALVGDMLQMIAVDPVWQGENLASRVVSALIREAGLRGRSCVYMIAKRQSAGMFADMGFRQVAVTQTAVLLEWGSPGIEAHCALLRQYAGEGRTGCVVMNANPFTRGHRHLIEQACAVCDRVFVLAVEEDRSEFPFAVRLALIRAGTADLPQVTVLPGSRYAISALTFPSYFVRDAEKARAESELDAELFGRYLAPALGVTDRFVAEEPFSPSTAVYNETLLRVLPGYGIAVHRIDRLTVDGRAVSATEVRGLLAAGKAEEVRPLVPQTTWDWIAAHRSEAEQTCRKHDRRP